VCAWNVLEKSFGAVQLAVETQTQHANQPHGLVIFISIGFAPSTGLESDWKTIQSVSVCPSDRLSVFMTDCLSFCQSVAFPTVCSPSVRLSVGLTVCLSA